MYAGRLLETGTASAIMREPAHPYTRGLLHSFPSLHGPRRELVGIPGSPPDLRDALPGCPFIPRCPYAIGVCEQVDMSLAPMTGTPGTGPHSPVPTSTGSHLTACPIVTAEVSQEGALS
jgi:oligopeptide/dipeptide ABC transporter ATP-binding protein